MALQAYVENSFRLLAPMPPAQRREALAEQTLLLSQLDEETRQQAIDSLQAAIDWLATARDDARVVGDGKTTKTIYFVKNPSDYKGVEQNKFKR